MQYAHRLNHESHEVSRGTVSRALLDKLHADRGSKHRGDGDDVPFPRPERHAPSSTAAGSVKGGDLASSLNLKGLQNRKSEQALAPTNARSTLNINIKSDLKTKQSHSSVSQLSKFIPNAQYPATKLQRGPKPENL